MKFNISEHTKAHSVKVFFSIALEENRNGLPIIRLSEHTSNPSDSNFIISRNFIIFAEDLDRVISRLQMIRWAIRQK